jgi:hypothetical protein
MSTNIPMKTAADAFLFLASVYRGLGTYHASAGRQIAQRYIEVGRDLEFVADLLADLKHFPARAVLAGFSVQRSPVPMELTCLLDEFIEPGPPEEVAQEAAALWGDIIERARQRSDALSLRVAAAYARGLISIGLGAAT